MAPEPIPAYEIRKVLAWLKSLEPDLPGNGECLIRFGPEYYCADIGDKVTAEDYGEDFVKWYEALHRHLPNPKKSILLT